MPSWSDQRGELHSVRSLVCDGASKFPGTWIASQPPGVSDDTNRGSRDRCRGTHCSAAFDTSTSIGPDGRQSWIRSSTNDNRSDFRDAAEASISSDESNPSTDAVGHRSASVAVSVPSPQPRSTTFAGAMAPIRATSSWNGRFRWSANRPYSSGSHILTPLDIERVYLDIEIPCQRA